MEVKHLIFDIGNTMIHYDSHLAYLDIIKDPTEREWFLTEVCNPDWTTELDKGESWSHAESRLIRAFPDQERRILHFRRHWSDMIPYSIAGTVDIFERAINEGNDVTVLSNFAHEVFDIALEKFPFILKARGITVSHKVGIIKPDRMIFEVHSERFNLDPKHCLLIDDREENIKGARAANWQAYHFQTPEKLLDYLNSRSIF